MRGHREVELQIHKKKIQLSLKKIFQSADEDMYLFRHFAKAGLLALSDSSKNSLSRTVQGTQAGLGRGREINSIILEKISHSRNVIQAPRQVKGES